MIWRWKIRQWLVQWVGTALLIVLAVGLFWAALRYAERAHSDSPADAAGEAMSEAARQRQLTP
jgi:protein-S-isoprenylcysteine O-methyltransferase Ste14